MILTEKKRTSTAVAKSRDYVVRLAENPNEVQSAQRLRFEVFNLELNEGLAESHFTGLDVDAFDAVCDHLIVEQIGTGEIVATYRLQTGQAAAANIGYYSEREFDFSPYESLRDETIELGRACVHIDHRSFNLLHLLWRGIARYARERQARFLVGCSSLTSQDPQEGMALYEKLQNHLVPSALRTRPRAEFVVVGGVDAGNASTDGALYERRSAVVDRRYSTTGVSSRLLRAYLAIGAKICGPPAIDREFGTIDFLTLLDLEELPAIVRAHFFG